ncbi:PD-(D/E)XK nuclease family transposase, partial [Clostridium grantii]
MENSNKLIRFDWFIKKMLRDKSNFNVLEGLLTALLKKDIVILNILESEGNQTSETNKFNRVDILVEDENKEKIIVEIQNERESDYLERV